MLCHQHLFLHLPKTDCKCHIFFFHTRQTLNDFYPSIIRYTVPATSTYKASLMECFATNIYSFTFQKLMTNATFCTKALLEIFWTEILVILHKETNICKISATNCKQNGTIKTEVCLITCRSMKIKY